MTRPLPHLVWGLLILTLSWAASSASALDHGCPVDVQLALEQSRAVCVDIGSDQVCYDNWQVSAEPVPPTPVPPTAVPPTDACLDNSCNAPAHNK
jgi:hypothetical protein